MSDLRDRLALTIYCWYEDVGMEFAVEHFRLTPGPEDPDPHQLRQEWEEMLKGADAVLDELGGTQFTLTDEQHIGLEDDVILLGPGSYRLIREDGEDRSALAELLRFARPPIDDQ